MDPARKAQLDAMAQETLNIMNLEGLEKIMRQNAHMLRNAFDALRTEGFTSEEAMELLTTFGYHLTPPTVT